MTVDTLLGDVPVRTDTDSDAAAGAADAAPGAPIGPPLWRRTRFWFGLLGLLVIVATLVAFLSPGPGRDLDPHSAGQGGSKALAQVLERYGVAVHRTTSLADASRAGDATVLVVEPDSYSAGQLLDLVRRARRTVLVQPGQPALDALAAGLEAFGPVSGTVNPGCGEPGPRAAGSVDFGDAAATAYSGPGYTECYDGAVVTRGRLAVLGDSDLLRNDTLARKGVAALDVNLISADRAAHDVVWLLPGADAAGPGAPSVWDLFPSGVHRAFLWLLITGAVLVLWQARRLGPPVPEPLPVVVRSAEVVEGHGRLYHRGRARARAATLLRAGTSARLARRLGLPRDANAAELAALAPAGSGAVELLAGAEPGNDTNLLELAAGLRQLEAAAGVAPEGKDAR